MARLIHELVRSYRYTASRRCHGYSSEHAHLKKIQLLTVVPLIIIQEAQLSYHGNPDTLPVIEKTL